MAVREFDGTDDGITTSVGSIGNIGAGAWSVLILAKPASKAVGEQYVHIQDNSSESTVAMADGGTTDIAAGSTNYFDTISNSVDTSWQILVLTCAGPGNFPRLHRAAIGSGFTRANADTNWVTNSITPTRVRFGFSGFGAGEYRDMRLAVAAVWSSALSDGSLDGVATAKTTQSVYDLSPIALWEFDQDSTATDVTDLIGSADQTAIVGTTVIADGVDDPSGWTFGISTAGQVLLASADSVDGNWLNESFSGTNLYASIDETTASNTDYIQSELSPQSSGVRVKLAAGGDPASSSGHEINWRIAKDTTAGQTINMTVKLYQGGGNSLGGGTLIADFDRNDVSSTFTDFAEALSGGEADAITDYTDLYLEFHADVP